MAFTLYHADQMPVLTLDEPEVTDLGDGLFRVRAEVVNERLIPTVSDRARTERIGLPDFFEIEVDGGRVVAGSGDRRLEITLSAESERRIALLTLPVTHVRLEFIGYGDAEAAAALARFDRGFQRGGG